MQHSENEQVDGQNFAVLFESLYVANLLILPVLAYVILVILFFKKHGSLPALAESHLEQTMSACIWIAVMVFVGSITIMILRFNEIEEATLWVVVVIVFTSLHATMVLLGVLGLAKALSGKCWRYPLFGKPLPPGCPE